MQLPYPELDLPGSDVPTVVCTISLQYPSLHNLFDSFTSRPVLPGPESIALSWLNECIPTWYPLFLIRSTIPGCFRADPATMKNAAGICSFSRKSSNIFVYTVSGPSSNVRYKTFSSPGCPLSASENPTVFQQIRRNHTITQCCDTGQSQLCSLWYIHYAVILSSMIPTASSSDTSIISLQARLTFPVISSIIFSSLNSFSSSGI